MNIVRKGEIGSIAVDAGQLSEVFVNLALNARYAMGRTGTFEIALSAVEVAKAGNSAFADQPVGRYVRIEVRDTGTGMDEVTRRRVFEPFFTTKPIGEGTGLGLASVFGAVTQNGGFIRVDSRPGEGTMFVIELPEVVAVGGADHERTVIQDLPETRRLLSPMTRRACVAGSVGVLQYCGYTVLEARDGTEALQLWADNAAIVRLVLTDLVMPGIDGRAVGERIAAQAPQVPILYMSAYTEDEIMRRQLLAPTGALMQKPFSAERLAQRVRAALDESARGTSGRVPRPS